MVLNNQILIPSTIDTIHFSLYDDYPTDCRNVRAGIGLVLLTVRTMLTSFGPYPTSVHLRLLPISFPPFLFHRFCFTITHQTFFEYYRATYV